MLMTKSPRSRGPDRVIDLWPSWNYKQYYWQVPEQSELERRENLARAVEVMLSIGADPLRKNDLGQLAWDLVQEPELAEFRPLFERFVYQADDSGPGDPMLFAAG